MQPNLQRSHVGLGLGVYELLARTEVEEHSKNRFYRKKELPSATNVIRKNKIK